MIRISVCDDDSVFAGLLSEQLKTVFDGLSAETEIKAFSSPKVFLHAVRTGAAEPDVVFLDIDMPGVSGFEIAEEIKKEKRGTVIVFVSGKHELVFESLDYHPFSFIRKNTGDGLVRDLGKVAAEIVADFIGNRVIGIRDVYSGMTYVPAKQIVSVGSENHYVSYSVENGKRKLKERGGIKTAEEKLRGCGFIRPHSRFLVNTAHIGFFSPKVNRIVMDDKSSVPVSRGQRATAYEEYLRYKRVF